METLPGGVANFQRSAFEKSKSLFAEQATGQDPETRFITSAGSRLVPHLITHTEPGDMTVWDAERAAFVPVTERYTTKIAAA